MKIIDTAVIVEHTARLCVRANTILGEDIRQALVSGMQNEGQTRAAKTLKMLLENADISREGHLPICQDTGMVVVFVELGQEVHIRGGSLTQAIQDGVSLGYRQGCLRASVVSDPIARQNTGDNTPAVVHYDVVEGDGLTITVAPKGFGSENMSRLSMLTPADGIQGIRRTVLQTVSDAGPNPCPPLVVGVGIGGTMEKAAIMSKHALIRPLGVLHPDPFWASEERQLLEAINSSGLGPAGLGGRTTALGVHIETYPTHIAGLPVAVNLSCHVTRHKSVSL